MFLCVVSPCHNNLCCGISVNGIMHLVLYRRKKIFCNLTVNGVINGSGINIRDFLVETALAGPDFLYFGNQMVKIILIEDLAVDQPAFI